MVVRQNFFELEVDEALGVKGTLELGWLGRGTEDRTATEIEIGAQTDDPGSTQVQREI